MQVGVQRIHDMDGQVVVKQKSKDVVAVIPGSLKSYFYFVRLLGTALNRLKQLLESIHVVGNGKTVGTNRTIRIENATVVLIFSNINSNTNQFDTSDVFISMLFRITDFFALVTSFPINRLAVSN